MDAFAVAIASSICLGSVTRAQVFRLSFSFGLFQAVMPVLGWLAGRELYSVISGWDHWVAFGLLAFVGGKAIHGALSRGDEDASPDDPTRGLNLLVLSVATSIDALAVGLSFAALQVAIWVPVIIIGLVAAAFTIAGMLGGCRLGRRFGRRMELVGGLVLIGIGVQIAVKHLLQ
jgi:putative Mn2+ efflux pump MntP